MCIRDSFQTRWLSFYGPAFTLRSRSYYQMLEPNGVEPSLVKDRIVFVGEAPIIGNHGISGDVRVTPRGAMPGVELQATAFLNLWRKEWLHEISAWRQAFLVTGFG